MYSIGNGIISWIKKSIQEYNNALYESLYHEKDPIKKTYTFSCILPQPKFSKEEVTLSDCNFEIIFSFYDYAYALHIYNAFLEQKQNKFPLHQNSMTLVNISVLKERQIDTNTIKIKTSSPIICRNHDRSTLKDMYYSFERPEFDQYININIMEQMKKEGLDTSLLEDFQITPICAKKIVIPVYEKKIECSIGTFKLSGNVKLLNYLYRAGIGSKRAMGFGLFDII